MNPDPAYGGNVDSTGRALILPGVFSGEEDFCEWIQHFESVAVINKWDDITVVARARSWKGTHSAKQS